MEAVFDTIGAKSWGISSSLRSHDGLLCMVFICLVCRDLCCTFTGHDLHMETEKTCGKWLFPSSKWDMRFRLRSKLRQVTSLTQDILLHRYFGFLNCFRTAPNQWCIEINCLMGLGVKLTRGGLMIVNCYYQLDYLESAQKHSLGLSKKMFN